MPSEESPSETPASGPTANSGPLGRHSLLVSASLALLGSLASVPEIRQGRVHGAAAWLIESSLIFETGVISILLFARRVRIELLALTCTSYFGVYLSLGCLLSLFDGQDPLHFIVFFLWFSPLLIFNRLVNRMQVADLFSKLLLTVPLFIVITSWIELKRELPESTLFLLINLALSHLMVGVMLEPLTRYRSAYASEKARADSIKTEAELMKLIAFYDPLTGLPNRIQLQSRIAEVLSERRSTTAGLLLIDLDDFRTLNDTLGHDTGDAFLLEVAARLVDLSAGEVTVARLGGDEFGLLLERLNPDIRAASREMGEICERIHVAFGKAFRANDYEWMTSTSIGLSVTNGRSDTADDLLRKADIALFKAKSLGKNRACHFDPEMEARVGTRAQLAGDLRRALPNDQFSLYYQPQVDSTGHLFGAEALLRWHHPERGLVSPTEFIPLAEETGLILSIGDWVLRTACAQLRAWSSQPGLRDLTMSVNVSVRQLTESSFVSAVKEVLQSSGIRPDRLKLEITESSVMEDVQDNIARMNELVQTGVRFSLDDFGTGHSSLAYLKRLPLDQVKIDRSFVSGVMTDVTDASIARTMILLAHDLDLAIVAEGVETRDQQNFLAEQGCQYYQGFLFSKPLTIEQFEEFARENRREVAAWAREEREALAYAPGSR